MRRTGPGILIGAAVIGLAIGFVLDQLLTSSGRSTFTPAVSLPILLVLLAMLVVALAIPVRRATRSRATAPVNPFQALRVAMLAKASSIVGAALAGFAGGLALFLLTRPVTPSVGSLGTVVATVVCGVLLIAGGLVAEYLCTIRKDDDDEQPGSGDPEPEPHHH
ncbi:DUF3180 family protein [Planococcus sp. APC 4015]|nr:DUF3180 family protein [Planococcus sp. APC 4015]